MFDLKSLLAKKTVGKWYFIISQVIAMEPSLVIMKMCCIFGPLLPPSLHVLCTLTHFLFAPLGFRRHRRLQDEKAKYVAFLLGNGKQMTGGATGLFI